MGKDFWKLTVTTEKSVRILLVGGIAAAILLGVKAYKETMLNGYELPRNEVSEGTYEQKIIADFGETKIPITVTVKERVLSKDEAEMAFSKAEEVLPELLKGKNESLYGVTTGLNFVDKLPDCCVEVEWTEKQSDYFYSDGKLREEVQLNEPVELVVSAILICQEYTKDYQTEIRIMPEKREAEQKLLALIEQKGEESRNKDVMLLPENFEGRQIIWRKPLDITFLYFFIFIIVAVFALKVGKKRDEKELQIKRLEELESDYAQIVSKFSMLLSAGLSIRNAWERIVVMQKRKGMLGRVVYQELNWGLGQMQKGVSELEVYEKFGVRVKEMHYKKLMALFISDKRRGSIPILEAMNQEMLLAWEERKRKTRQQGEKIGTKLLIPMMGMLSVVFVMVLVPAFLSFRL